MSKQLPRYLVPLHGDATDDGTVSLACDLARLHKAEVWVLYVIQIARRLPLDAFVPEETSRGEAVLSRVEEIGKDRKVRMHGEILQARDVGPAIVQEAADREAQVIVLGMPETERYGVFTMGEVVPHVLKHSPCRVIVTRAQPSPQVVPSRVTGRDGA